MPFVKVSLKKTKFLYLPIYICYNTDLDVNDHSHRCMPVMHYGGFL